MNNLVEIKEKPVKWIIDQHIKDRNKRIGNALHELKKEVDTIKTNLR